MAGVEGREIIYLLEDHQVLEPTYLELINSVLSSGEVPGLFSPEELESLLAPLRDAMSEEGYRGTMLGYFSQRIRTNLHIVLIMDSKSEDFTVHCKANPAFYTQCAFQSMEGWSSQSMQRIPQLFLQNVVGMKLLRQGDATKRPITGGDDLVKTFLKIHQSCFMSGGTPRRYIAFLKTYKTVYSKHKETVAKKQTRLRAGVSKLNEATALVDELKQKAAKQRALLAEKQNEADAALQEITTSMQSATEQKREMEDLKQQQSQKRVKLEKRKKAIDIELSEIEPLVREAQLAVGNIKPETLAEIRALRAPPEVIRDILEGVLRTMGVLDTTWGSMRSFLARRGVKEDIKNFDARAITPEIRENVQELLELKKHSFEQSTAKRASAAVVPLAAWVKANIRFSYVLEKIGPLEEEQATLIQNLDKSEKRLAKLLRVLEALDRKVQEMKNRFEQLTTEAAKLRIEVEKEEEIIAAAENLVGKLEGEHRRWSDQVGELADELKQLPWKSLLAAAFITYLSKSPEDERRNKVAEWLGHTGLDSFNLRQFLSTESEQLKWKAEGLPSDDVSMENALMILQGELVPFLIDPSQRATEWLKTHLKDTRLEVINQQDSNFTTALELAVRFGKTLIIQEVDGVEPLLYPLVRRDLESQGPRFVVQIGEKVIDYNEDFRLFLTTRNPQPHIPPDVDSVIAKVNFTTTRAGLRAQLLASTIQNEKPELEQRKTELLKTEEDLKVQLAALEESLLEELASAEGNILENKALLESLNQTKAKSSTITTSLVESQELQTSLDKERDSYLPLSQFGSMLYFVISDLTKLNNMYSFSLSSFLRLFQRALQSKQDIGNTDLRIRTLTSTIQSLVYEYVCLSLFKADRLMFALHLAHGMHPQLFQPNEWEAFTGQLVTATMRRQESIKQMKESAPSWCSQEQAVEINNIKSNFPSLYTSLGLHNREAWLAFVKHPHCEKEFPHLTVGKITAFQQLLVIKALRPDRLQSAMELFTVKVLSLKDLSPANLNLRRLYEVDTLAKEPILVIISPGADPSQEIEELAESVVGSDRFHQVRQERLTPLSCTLFYFILQVAMGQGQADVALKLLRDCSINGDWLCLKNLHLVTGAYVSTYYLYLYIYYHLCSSL